MVMIEKAPRSRAIYDWKGAYRNDKNVIALNELFSQVTGLVGYQNQRQNHNNNGTTTTDVDNGMDLDDEDEEDDDKENGTTSSESDHTPQSSPLSRPPSHRPLQPPERQPSPPSGPEFISFRDYQSESSNSEFEAKEIDPMDDSSDSDAQQRMRNHGRQQFTPPQPQPQPPATTSSIVSTSAVISEAATTTTTDEPMLQEEDVAMASSSTSPPPITAPIETEPQQQQQQQQEQAEEPEEPEEEDTTTCIVCHRFDLVVEILLCDACDDEYHLTCLSPPLSTVPAGNWYCPNCRLHPTTHDTPKATIPPRDQDQRQESTAVQATDTQVVIKQEQATNGGSATAEGNTLISRIIEDEAAKSNQLLIHACACEAVRCVDPTFALFCHHMKRFLRSACWASHNEQWRSFRIGKALRQLFLYHAEQCQEAECSVPLCERFHDIEMV